MIGLDTNILIRYLINDDPKQAAVAKKFIETKARTEKFFINHIVLCELVWVLLGSYKLSKNQVLDTLEKILSTEEFEVENSQQAWEALSDYRESGADFSDCLIGRINRAAGCSTSISFDKSVKTLKSFEILS
ncbi:MAG: type II toxin-antitoxin system VapC family toxin [Deltaproteobacteria bacterium]|nr:type II toxin-antitoxin system VapC family toxin [Deltaproteobacteria bacterium]